MIVEYTRYKIDESRCKSFEEDYVKAVDALMSSSHSIASELSHCTEDPNDYVLRIGWDSEKSHLKGFRSSPEVKTFFAMLKPYLKEIEQMRHHDVLTANRSAK
jgi:hemoglobin